MASTEANTPTIDIDDLKNRRAQPIPPARRNGRWSGYRHLLWVRILELKREPEVVFWVFVFPLLLAAGLGIAFRNKPADVTSVVVIESAGAQKTLSRLTNSANQRSAIRASVLDRESALKGFHFGKYDLVDRVGSRWQLHLLLRSRASGERSLARRNRRRASVRRRTQRCRWPLPHNLPASPARATLTS